MNFLFIIIVTCLAVYAHAEPLDEGQVAVIASSDEWQRLLHFTKNSRRSQISSPNFFIFKNGQDDYVAELKSNLELFLKDESYACKFPARAALLGKKLNVSFRNCPEVEEWKELIQAKTVSLVYVTQYVSNPVSIFGHSFLLFQNNERPLNLDVVFNNAANVPENVSTYDYVVKGMFGGFPTVYTKEPFYIKIQEYNNIENRDLWSYQLNLSATDIDQLLNHLWELANLKDEQYYFLNSNCAFNIYNALAAVHSELDFIEEPRLYVLPVETVQRVHRITRAVSYYPSIREKLVQRYKKIESDGATSIDNAEINLELYEYKKSQNGGQLSAEDLKLYNGAMLYRSKLGRRLTPLEYIAPNSPDKAHPTWNLSLGVGKEQEKNLTALSISPFSHSLLQNETGFLPYSEIIVLKASFQKKEEEKFNLDQLTLLKMGNFIESAGFDSQYSWHFAANLNRNIESNYQFNGFVDAGKTKSYLERNIFFGLIGLSYNEDQIFKPEAKLGTVFKISKVKLQAQFTRTQSLSKNHSSWDVFELAGNYQLKKNLDIEGSSTFVGQKSRYTIKLGYSF